MKRLALLAALLFLTSCGFVRSAHDSICPGCKPWTKYYGSIVCEPNGGPCHSASARVVPISADETNALYYSPDIFSVYQGYVGATASNRWGTLLTPEVTCEAVSEADMARAAKLGQPATERCSRKGVFFTTGKYDWDEKVPEQCGAPGKFKIGAYVGHGHPTEEDLATAEREPSVLTSDCAIYLPFEMFNAKAVIAAEPKLKLACVDDRFTVIDCAAAIEHSGGAFAYNANSALAVVRPGDKLTMPPINTASR